MRQAVVTVEAIKCHLCPQLIDPVDGVYFQRQVKTAVEIGGRYGPVERYEVVNVCPSCNHLLEEQAAVEQHRKWWFRFWCVAVIVNIVLIALFPVGWFPLFALIVVRLIWKWRAQVHAEGFSPPMGAGLQRKQ